MLRGVSGYLSHLRYHQAVSTSRHIMTVSIAPPHSITMDWTPNVDLSHDWILSLSHPFSHIFGAHCPTNNHLFIWLSAWLSVYGSTCCTQEHNFLLLWPRHQFFQLFKLKGWQALVNQPKIPKYKDEFCQAQFQLASLVELRLVLILIITIFFAISLTIFVKFNDLGHF